MEKTHKEQFKKNQNWGTERPPPDVSKLLNLIFLSKYYRNCIIIRLIRVMKLTSKKILSCQTNL